MDLQRILELATEAGFTLAAQIDPKTIIPMPEVRNMCAENKCKQYDKNWACPPACGGVDECANKIAQYNLGVIVETTGILEDDFDFEGMQAAAETHGKSFIELVKKIRENYKNEDMLPLGSGGCTYCKECTYPNAPCRFPDRMIHPMEGYGILISDVCQKNQVKYNHGRGTLTYVGCVLFNE